MTVATKSLLALVLVALGFAGANALGPAAPDADFWASLDPLASPPANPELLPATPAMQATAVRRLAASESFALQQMPPAFEAAVYEAAPQTPGGAPLNDPSVRQAVASVDRASLEPVDGFAPGSAPPTDAWQDRAPLAPAYPAAPPIDAWGSGAAAPAMEPPQLLQDRGAQARPISLGAPPLLGGEPKYGEKPPFGGQPSFEANAPQEAFGAAESFGNSEGWGFEEPSSARTHVVTDGDTLPKLAERYLGAAGRWPELYQANRAVLNDPDLLPIGARLVAPGASSRMLGAPVGSNIEPVTGSGGYGVSSPPRAQLMAPALVGR